MNISTTAAGEWTAEHENLLGSRFPLHLACRDGNTVWLRHILQQIHVTEAHMIIDEDDFYKWTAAHYAAYFGRVECLKLLKEACQQYNTGRALRGLPVLSCPLLVRSRSCRQSVIHVAAFADHPQCLQWLLSNGAPVNGQDSNGESALHKACRSEARACARILATNGINISARNDKGQTALQLTEDSGYHDLARDLTDLIKAKHPNSSSEASTSTGGITNGVNQRNHTNYLVSTNAYYGYHSNNTAVQCTNTTINKNNTNGSGEDCSMDMEDLSDDGAQQQSSAGPSMLGGDLLMDPKVGQNLVAVAGKKRTREDDECNQSKKPRMQDDGGWEPLTRAAATTLNNSSFQQQHTSASINSSGVVHPTRPAVSFGASQLPVTATSSVASVGGSIASLGGSIASLGGSIASLGGSIAPLGGSVASLRSSVTSQGGSVAAAGASLGFEERVASHRSNSTSSSNSSDSQDSGIASLSSMEEEDEDENKQGGQPSDDINVSYMEHGPVNDDKAVTYDSKTNGVSSNADSNGQHNENSLKFTNNNTASNGTFVSENSDCSPHQKNCSSFNPSKIESTSPSRAELYSSLMTDGSISNWSGVPGCPIPAPAHLLNMNTTVNNRRFMGGHFF
uniref:Ankyrin repeat domain-containing protein 10-like isoform X3 n=2 Tax=Hirondellea gigas TaxID=1518452 RepID=A0A6A7G3M5_9CRUS